MHGQTNIKLGIPLLILRKQLPECGLEHNWI